MKTILFALGIVISITLGIIIFNKIITDDGFKILPKTQFSDGTAEPLPNVVIDEGKWSSAQNWPTFNESDYSGWKTHTDNNQGISLKYPPTLKIINIEDEPGDELIFGTIDEYNEPTSIIRITKQAGKMEDPNTLKRCPALEEGFGREILTDPCLNSDLKYTNIGESRALDYYYSQGASSNWHVVVFDTNPKVQMKVYLSDNSIDMLFKKMVATVKFAN